MNEDMIGGEASIEALIALKSQISMLDIDVLHLAKKKI